LGAGSGALFGELTGEGAAKGAESGAIGGAAGPLGAGLGEAVGIGSDVGGIIGGAAGGAGGAAVTGSNPLIGAAEGAAAPAINAVAGWLGGTTAITPSSPSTGGPTAAGTGASAGAQSAASLGQLDPTAGGGGPPSAFLGTITGGGPNVDGAGAMGLSDPTFMLPTGTTSTGDNTFSATGFTPITGAGVTSGGTIDAGGGFGADIMGLIQRNPGALLSGGLLASQLFRGNEPYPAEKQLQNLATNAGTQGQALSGYLQSGTLPPGAQANVDASTNAAEARIRAANARLGLSGSTMEAQQLGEAKQQAAGQQFLIANELLGQGAKYTNISANIYDELLKSQAGTDQEFQKALMAFAGGLGGLRGGGTSG
jgi:hypothetical protein